jgi:hypothetical protein
LSCIKKHNWHCHKTRLGIEKVFMCAKLQINNWFKRQVLSISFKSLQLSKIQLWGLGGRLDDSHPLDVYDGNHEVSNELYSTWSLPTLSEIVLQSQSTVHSWLLSCCWTVSPKLKAWKQLRLLTPRKSHGYIAWKCHITNKKNEQRIPSLSSSCTCGGRIANHWTHQ